MGYTSGHPPMFSLEMKQTQSNVAKVLDLAGWSYTEASEHCGIDFDQIMDAVMPNEKWHLLLEKAGSRAFDHDEDAE